jgi:hypothetical protein
MIKGFLYFLNFEISLIAKKEIYTICFQIDR